MFHFIQASSNKALGVGKTNCDADGSSKYKIQRLLVWWVEHFQVHFSWNSVPAPPSAIPAYVQCPFATGPTAEVDILMESRA